MKLEWPGSNLLVTPGRHVEGYGGVVWGAQILGHGSCLFVPVDVHLSGLCHDGGP